MSIARSLNSTGGTVAPTEAEHFKSFCSTNVLVNVQVSDGPSKHAAVCACNDSQATIAAVAA